MQVVVRLAQARDAAAIAQLAVALTEEIVERTQIKHFDVDVAKAGALCEKYIEAGIYTVLLAVVEEAATPIGFAALCESHALYTEGPFGIVQEFYVAPQFRSCAVGRALLAQARIEAQQRGWMRLELCTPPLPEFERALAFYADNGFEVTGGRKMKCVIDGI